MSSNLEDVTTTYDQYCAMARALEVIGDRWTLLLVRELLTGAKRYGELARGLPGIATNLLADRLRNLTSAGVIERTPGHGSPRGRPYQLTARGAELQPVLLALARWGAPLLGAPRPHDDYRLRWLVLTLQSRFDPAAAGDLERTYEFRIGDEIVHARIADGAVHTAEGAAHDPDVIVASAVDLFLAWGTGRRSTAAAVADGINVLGRAGVPHADPTGALEQIAELFGAP
jgi:DNA-binding HxlR family transcriptional regulator